MIFVDTDIFMYAVGKEHPLRETARDFFRKTLQQRDDLVTSVEVLQEFLHAYLPVNRIDTLDAALTLAKARTRSIWSLEVEDVDLARALANGQLGLNARDILHLACCKRRDVRQIKTFDRAFAMHSRPD